MRSLNILISGAGIAGPALAHWLVRYGHRVTVVERAPGPRPGGQAVDFKGATQLAVLRRMGLLEEVRAHQTGGTDTVMVDARGRERARIPAEFTGGDVEIVRGDLVRILHAATAPHCDYRFGDSLAALREEAGGVRAVFDSGAEHTFDLVVGADGIHSRTRALAFGPEERHVRYLGAHYAIATLPEDGPPLPAPAPAPGGPLVALMRSTPGRTAVYGGTSAMFVFAADPPPAGRADDADRRRLLAAAFANAAEPVADLVERALRADDLFVDSISRVQMPSYTRGRVALLGDAAFGNTLAGFGTGLAVIGAACVLAGELAAADGDHTAAFARCGALMRRHAAPARTGNASTFLAPSTAMGLWLRERMFASPRLTRLLLKSTDAFATAGELPDYPRPAPRP